MLPVWAILLDELATRYGVPSVRFVRDPLSPPVAFIVTPVRVSVFLL